MVLNRYADMEEEKLDFSPFMTPVDENCSLCLHVITNPMGRECYLKHVDNWLFSHDMGDIERRIILDHIRKKLPSNNPNNEMCVICGEEYLSICSYCFASIASRVLSELKFSRDFRDDFEYIFTFKGAERKDLGGSL